MGARRRGPDPRAFRWGAPPSALVTLIALSAASIGTGCSWISQNAFEDKLASIDEDGDGTIADDDCNDRDPEVFPGAIELPYDGVDSDCDKEDLVDVDLDGYPGIGAEAYAALGSTVPYPPKYVDLPLDCADDPAVEPEAAFIHPDPSHAIEVPYDGLDSDCQKDNDFDVDGDGFMPDAVTIDGVSQSIDDAFPAYLAQWAIPADAVTAWAPVGHAAPVGGDCDDQDGTVHPENDVAEVYYDGIDRDCDDHNDFDQDGDCFMPADAEPLYAAYVARYYPGGVPPFCVDPELPFGDCLDERDPGIVSYPDRLVPDPATVHPDTSAYPLGDPPYDAIDADCAADDDFDGDHDGFMPDVFPDPVVDLMNQYAAMWGYTDLVPTWGLVNPDAGLTVPVAGDCDDARDDTWPDALEVLGDGIDQDCHGDPDTSTFGFGDAAGDFDWTTPTNPEIVRIGDRYLVMLGAESADIAGELQSEFGVALPFSLATARGAAMPVAGSPPYWKATTPSLEIQGLVDIALDPAPIDDDGDAIPDPIVMAAYNTDNTGTSYTHLNVNGVQYHSNSGLLSPVSGTTDFITASYVARSLDLLMDPNGEPFALACAQNRLHMTFSLDDPPPRATLITGSGDACFFDSPTSVVGTTTEATFRLCEAAACEAWTATDVPALLQGAPTADTWVYGDQDEGWIALVAADGSGFVRPVGGADQAVFPGQDVLHLDVAESAGVVYVAAVIAGGGGPEVWLAYGPPGNFVEQRLPFNDVSVGAEVPTYAAVFADADRVAVAVTAFTGAPGLDSVGWVFFGPP